MANMLRHERTERQCSSMELDSLIQVGQDVPLLESESKATGKVVKKWGSTGVARGQCHLRELMIVSDRSDRTSCCCNLI